MEKFFIKKFKILEKFVLNCYICIEDGVTGFPATPFFIVIWPGGLIANLSGYSLH